MGEAGRRGRRRLSTFMTGELFQLLRTGSILRQAVEGAEPPRPETEGFAEGFAEGFRHPPRRPTRCSSCGRAGSWTARAVPAGGAAVRPDDRARVRRRDRALREPVIRCRCWRRVRSRRSTRRRSQRPAFPSLVDSTPTSACATAAGRRAPSSFRPEFIMSDVTARVAWPAFKRSLVAILRGIKPEEVEASVETLIEAVSKRSRSR